MTVIPGGIPRVRRPRRNRWWEPALLAMRNPGTPVLVGNDIPRSEVNSARQLRHWPPEVVESGVITVNVRGTHEVDGRTVGDLYFTFHPHSQEN